MATPRRAPDVVGLAEVSELSGAALSTVRSWIVRGTTPVLPPHTQLASGPVWRRTDIEAWLATRNVNAAAAREND